MRKAFVISLLAVIVLACCQVNEIVETTSDSKSFTASIEDSFNGGNTRTSLDDNGNVLFKMGDQISIFAGSTVNEHYQVTDASDGKTSAVFNKVTGSGFVGGGEIDNNVAFYPYAASAEISKSGSAYVISDISLPATQNYAEGSFGNGAFPMAAVTDDTDDLHLKFKNVLGGLKLQLKGTATITSITVTGNNDEILCGDAEVTVSNTSAPFIDLTDASAKTVSLDCGEGVALDSGTATPFIIALPPMTMESGFTIVVTDTEGKQMEIKTTKTQTINRSMLLKMPEVTYEGIPMSSPLTFTSTGATSISLKKVGSLDDVSLEYSINGGDWTAYTATIKLSDGEKVSFRAGANGNSSFGKSNSDYHKFTVSGSGTVAASGSIMSLINQEESLVIPSPRCFSLLFYGCTRLTTAPELPATTLADSCYSYMFCGCTSLTTAPELPATTLANSCYSYMFYGCTSLTTAPELPATTLANSCYRDMFYGCTSLTTAPELPATTLANSCYSYMFYRCTTLTTAPELPATTLANSCYRYMFSGCDRLTTAPELPATTLAEYCYDSMFSGCDRLTTAPELPATTLAESCYHFMFNGCVLMTTAPDLPATTLAEGCYSGMFYGCTSLTTAPDLPATTLAKSCYSAMFHGCVLMTTAPDLPATTLAEGCYSRMFYGCTSLTTAPELPATTLAESCYDGMFSGCSGLNYIKALFTTTPGNTYTEGWVSGVASTGTFVKSKDATWEVTGVSGVPKGWTVFPRTHTFVVSPLEISVEADATAAEINVEGDVAWTAAGEGVTLDPASGEGNGKIAVSFPANDNSETVTYTVKVSTAVQSVETLEYTVVITQKKHTLEMLAQWHFCAVEADVLGAHFAEAAKIDGAVNPAANLPGFGEDLYCAANESGNGKIMFYNATDKTDINPKGRCKRGIGNLGEPCWYGAWLGDYIWFEATPTAPLAAGTTLNIWFTLRPNTQNTLKYWLLEINDGGTWVPVGEVKKASVNGVDVNYNIELVFDPNGAGTTESPRQFNSKVYRNYTLTKSVDKVEYRIVCQSLMIADGTKVVTYIGESSANKDENSIVRICGEDSSGGGSTPVTHHTWIAIVK